jgi:hypothetical protein
MLHCIVSRRVTSYHVLSSNKGQIWKEQASNRHIHPHRRHVAHAAFGGVLGFKAIKTLVLRDSCSSMAVDRSAEFHAAVSSISSRSSKSPVESRRLLASHNERPARTVPKSDFSRMAAKIGHDINSTSTKLQQLAQCMSLW